MSECVCDKQTQMHRVFLSPVATHTTQKHACEQCKTRHTQLKAEVVAKWGHDPNDPSRKSPTQPGLQTTKEADTEVVIKETAEQSRDDTSTRDPVAGAPAAEGPQVASKNSPQGIPRKLPPLEKEISAGLAACAGSMKTKALLFRELDSQKGTEK